jgi:hypothetical protein
VIDVIRLDRRTAKVDLDSCIRRTTEPGGSLESVARDQMIFGQGGEDGNSLRNWLKKHYAPVTTSPPEPSLHFTPSLEAIWETPDGRIIFAELRGHFLAGRSLARPAVEYFELNRQVAERFLTAAGHVWDARPRLPEATVSPNETPLKSTMKVLKRASTAKNLIQFLYKQPDRKVSLRDLTRHLYSKRGEPTRPMQRKAQQLVRRTQRNLAEKTAPLCIEWDRDWEKIALLERP